MGSEQIENEILEEGLDDWIPVDRVIGLARDEAEARHGDFKELTLKVLESLLLREEIKVGAIGDMGFEAWSGAVSELIERVVTELNSVDWQPYGGGCWICNTANGDERARGRRA